MDMDCSQLAALVVNLPLVQGCDKVRSGALRMATPFLYPNGERIDVFIDSDKELWSDFYLSDRGQTALYLRNAQVFLDTTARKRELVDDILRESGVKLVNGYQLTIRPSSHEPVDVSDAIFRLSQMCVRISDLATHQRMRSSNPFRDDVEEFFESHNLRYKSDVKLPPVFGKREIRMDFEVHSGMRSSYVNVLAAMNDASAHSSANEIVVKLHDLKESGQVILHQFVTVYNSASSAIRIEDIQRLQTLSSAVSYPEEMDSLLSILGDNDPQERTNYEVNV
jgi:hypothetical protein